MNCFTFLRQEFCSGKNSALLFCLRGFLQNGGVFSLNAVFSALFTLSDRWDIFAAVVSKALFKSSDADFVTANLLIGVFNLIPLYPLDGGNILLVLLYGRVGTDRTYEIMKMVGRGIRGLLLAAGIYILISGKNPSMLLTIIFLPGLGTVKGR
ncbi:site-2 protease family protein [Thermoclostridium stercorarium]|uniref:site-2 protease family protein n=1 Tax=Thermoclostridium stercorarium TaxID=1510 RepID=UPI000A8D9B29|nr:site-2 protease family protein [Thermoclostridium stercorarium]